MPVKSAELKTEPAADKATAQRNKNLDLALQQIAKDYGDGAIMRLGDHSQTNIDVIPTGNIMIDRALGVGGFPRGRIVEIYGPESSGKTTLTLTVIAQAQRRGGLAAFIDVEHALDPKYAQRLGVNLDDLLVSQARRSSVPTHSTSLCSIRLPRSSPSRNSRARLAIRPWARRPA